MAFKTIEILTEKVYTPFKIEPVEMSYLQLLKEILNAGGALNRQELKLRDKTELVLDTARTDVDGKTFLDIEEEDWKMFAKCANDFIWTFRAPFFSKFLNLFD